MASNNQEIELKLVLEPGELTKLLALKDFQGFVRPGSQHNHLLTTYYYDTKDLKLRQQGIAFRIRDKGDGSFEATVKTRKKTVAAGLAQRLEINIPLSSPEPVLTGFKERGLGFELTDFAPEGVTLLFTSAIKRTTYLLDYKGAVIELAIDKGEIVAGAKSAVIDELELELMEGDVSAILELEQLWSRQIKMRPEDISKFMRGLALLEA